MSDPVGDQPLETEPVIDVTPPVAHISTASRLPLAEVLGGSEPTHMTPQVAANIEVLNEPTACNFLSDSSMEVNLLGRSLDILASAELPGTGEEIQVAIENQYGVADPDHFGRLVGWYMPETGARMGILIAEAFEPQLIKAVNDGLIIAPEHGLWLVEACGFQIGSEKLVTYQTRACSLPRASRLRREQIYLKGGNTGANRSASNAEAERRAVALFDHIKATGEGWIADALTKTQTTTGFYRWMQDNGASCHIEMFVGTDRISVGSCYLKSGFDDDQIDLLLAANSETETDPTPSRRYLRGSWWDLRSDVGRKTPASEWSPNLGVELERAFEAIRDAVETHQAALLAATNALPPESTASAL